MSNFLQILAEIVEKIEIVGLVTPAENQNFTVRHPDYPPLEFQPETIAKLEQISPQLQAKYLTSQVQNYLYDIYFSHSLMSLEELVVAGQQPRQIKNNIINGIDIDFCQRLEQSNTSNGYFDFDWQVIAETETGELIVVKDGLHLHIDRQRHLAQNLQQTAIGDTIPIYLPPNLVGQDTYIIVGNAGTPNAVQSRSDEEVKLVQLYFNFTPDAAVEIAHKLTHELNTLNIPFQFAILHDPALFYRYDPGTLWLPQAGYLEMQTVLTQIYQVYQAEFSPNVPLFSKQLAPGLGIAEIPATPGTFGMQRCELLAEALLAVMEQDLTLTADKLSLIRQELTTAGIDWLRPYLNPTALDCYNLTF
jgi:HopA1 effector protein family